jgi:hypothetical protein
MGVMGRSCYLCGSNAAMTSFAENYVGLPFELGG